MKKIRSMGLDKSRERTSVRVRPGSRKTSGTVPELAAIMIFVRMHLLHSPQFFGRSSFRLQNDSEPTASWLAMQPTLATRLVSSKSDSSL